MEQTGHLLPARKRFFVFSSVTRLDSVICFEDYGDDRRSESLLVSLGAAEVT
jgi:hypothetical protein